MKKLLYLILLVSTSAMAQRQTGGISFTPQFNYKGTGDTSRIQLYNSLNTTYTLFPRLKGGNNFTGSQRLDTLLINGLWAADVTPDNSNYVLKTASGNTRLNAATTINFGVGGSSNMFLNSGAGLIIGYPTQISSAPTANNHPLRWQDTTRYQKYGTSLASKDSAGTAYPIVNRTGPVTSKIIRVGGTNRDLNIYTPGSGQVNFMDGRIGFLPSNDNGPDFGTGMAGIAFRKPVETMDRPFFIFRAGQYLFEDSTARWMASITPTGANFGSIRDEADILRPQNSLEAENNFAVGTNYVRYHAAPTNGAIIEGALLRGYHTNPGGVFNTYGFLNKDGAYFDKNVYARKAISVGTSDTAFAAHLFGKAGFPNRTGTTQKAIVRLNGDNGSNGVLDIGVNGPAAYMQVTNQSDLSNIYPLYLNPNGGKVIVGDTLDNGSSATYQVKGNVSFKNGSNSSLDLELSSSSSSGTRMDFNSTLSGQVQNWRIGTNFLTNTKEWAIYDVTNNKAAIVATPNTGAIKFSQYGAGAATFDASGNITSVSDERLKNIKRYDKTGLSAILKLKPIVFKYNKLSGMEMEHEYAGFSAQNVKANIPLGTGQNAEGYLSLQDRAIMAALVNSVKELQAEIVKLKKQIKRK